MRETGLQIEHQCPQCGAPITLNEADHLVSCGFCRVRSFVVSRDQFHYILPHNAPAGKSLIYVPYWRFKGMLFSCLDEEIRHRIVDSSCQALQAASLPPSLGLRSQTLKLRFLGPETEGAFLKPRLSRKAFMTLIDQQFRELLPKPVFHQSFIGETLSLIYSPFYVDSGIHDAILNRPLAGDVQEDADLESLKDARPQWRIRFVPALCPNCGWDLDGERDSLVLVCRNCNSAWQAGKEGFAGINFVHMPEKGEDVTYLPFYRIKAEITGITLESYADLVRVGNLPKVVQPQWENIPFRLWFPAFKVRPKDLLGFSRNLTLSQPREALVSGFPDGNTIHPVTLAVREALDGLKITLASFLKPRRIMFPKLSAIRIKPEKYVLVYLPFHRKGNELSQAAFRLRINQNLLSHARHL
ncbi:MAG: hypothetical protein ACOWYE_15350 [Desulfatiglandales bacterium]